MKKFLSNINLPFNKGESQIIEDLRRNKLNISLPRLGEKNKQLELNSKKLESHLATYNVEKSQQIIEALKYLEQLNKSDVKIQIRYDLTNGVLTTVSQSINNIYRNYVSKGVSFPESMERKTELTSTINLLQSLMISYKVILAKDYALPIKKFNQKLEQVKFISLKIIELTLWLQRMLAVRYQKLSSQNWRDLNVIFSVYANHFDIKEEKTLTEFLSLYQASGIVSAKNNKRSVASMYLSMQILGLLDISSWPSYSLQSLEKYVAKHEDLMVLSFDETCDTADEVVITYSDYHNAPMFEKDETGQASCCIHIDKIKKQISNDIEVLDKINFIGDGDKKRLKASGKVEDLEDNAGLMQLFLKNLSKGERQAERKALYGAKVVYIYNGLGASYRLLYQLKESRPGSSDNDGYLQNAAARNSSLLLDSDADVLESQWRIVNESTGGYLIRTTETKYMHSMEVGQLIAITSDEKEDVPQLGYITRLDRLHENEVDVAVVKITNFAEAVTILDPGQENKGHDLLPGILIKNLADVWQLVLPKQVKYVTGTPVIINRGNEHIPVRLGNVVLTKKGFVLFEARSPGLR